MGALNELNRLSDEVFYTVESTPVLTTNMLLAIEEAAKSNESGKARICCHDGEKDSLHEMFIAHKRGCYVRPHKHIDKIESFYLISGSAYLLLFGDCGSINKVHKIGQGSGELCYYRLRQPVYHSLLILSPVIVFHEVTAGPFRPEETLFPEWAPEPGSEQVLIYMKELESQAVKVLACGQ